MAGVDEVGRGAFAGPVVAAAVVWGKNQKIILPASVKIDDSKKLKPRQRERAGAWIRENASGWGIGEVGPAVINRAGLGLATKMAFRQAVADLKTRLPAVDFLLIDAFFIPYVKSLRHKRQKAIVNGDEKVVSIAAASILAKVHRDSLMRKLARKHTAYGWGRNKGYGTAQHQRAIRRHGVTRLHRKAHVATFLARLNGV